jgi:hypothetical protein
MRALGTGSEDVESPEAETGDGSCEELFCDEELSTWPEAKAPSHSVKRKANKRKLPMTHPGFCLFLFINSTRIFATGQLLSFSRLFIRIREPTIMLVTATTAYSPMASPVTGNSTPYISHTPFIVTICFGNTKASTNQAIRCKKVSLLL